MAGRGLRIWSPLVAVCLGGLMLAACGKGSSAGSSASSTPASKAATGSQSSVASKKPVVIGASLSLSGDFSADGQAFQRGYELWADYVNHHGGLLGHPVKLDILSDASSPTQAVTNYEKLISSNHVALTFGPFSSLLTIPTSRVPVEPPTSSPPGCTISSMWRPRWRTTCCPSPSGLPPFPRASGPRRLPTRPATTPSPSLSSTRPSPCCRRQG